MKKMTKTGVRNAALLLAGIVIAGCDSGGVQVGSTDLASIDATPAFIQRGCGQSDNSEIFCPD